MKRRQIRKIEYVGEVIRPDKDTSVSTRHEDLYKITVVTPGEGEEERLVSVKDRWFDQPTRVYPDRFNDAVVEQVGEIENVWRSWHMYLDAFKKAHPEVAQEMEKNTNEPTDQEIHLFGTDLIVHKTHANSYTNFHCRECYFNFMGRCQAILNGKHLCSCKDGCDQWFELKKDGTQQ